MKLVRLTQPLTPQEGKPRLRELSEGAKALMRVSSDWDDYNVKLGVALIATLLITVGFAGPTVAGPLEEARAADNRGDYTTELRLLRPLAEQGNAEAQEAVGTLYVMGCGVPQDYVEAVKWFRMAAEQGIAEAMDSLARMYIQGEGVPKDYVRAHMWFTLAAARRHPEPGHLNIDAGARDNLAEEMTLEQVAEAQRLAREWESRHPIVQARPQ
jgi:hypothetical protein